MKTAADHSLKRGFSFVLQGVRQSVTPRPVGNRHFALWLLLALLPIPSLAQEPLARPVAALLPSLAQEPVARPVAALHFGVGNHYGWLGGGVEAYLARARFSLFAGLGVAPQGPTVAGAAGVRYYLGLGATPHRLFADLSVSLMGLSMPTVPGGALYRDYGLGVSIGYSYLAQSGFTLTVGGGVGASDFGADLVLLPVVQIAAGWTWRR